MAKIILSGLVSAIKGSIGGSTFQNYKGSTIIRTKPRSSKQTSLIQQDIRHGMNIISQAWSALPEADKTDWNNFAITRNKQKHTQFKTTYSGYQLYYSINFYSIVWNDVDFPLPVLNSNNLIDTDIVAVTGSPNFEIEFDRPLVETDEVVILFMSCPVSSGLNNPGSKMKAISDTNTNTEFLNFETGYFERFGIDLQAGDEIFIKYALFDKLSGYVRAFKVSKNILV